jgi:hypothetical protein
METITIKLPLKTWLSIISTLALSGMKDVADKISQQVVDSD